jgi:RNA polymerase subunit RPABC4/transcription elongation factor Spt4
MTQRRCQSCRTFYNKRLEQCPECRVPKYAFNKGLWTSRLNTQLYSQAERAK